jgi:hypothetical protein
MTAHPLSQFPRAWHSRLFGKFACLNPAKEILQGLISQIRLTSDVYSLKPTVTPPAPSGRAGNANLLAKLPQTHNCSALDV